MTFEIEFIFIGIMLLFAFFIQGTTGFGCTVIAAPVVIGLLGVAEGVPFGTLMTLPFLYYLGIKTFREVSWKDLIKIVVLCMPGIVFGNYVVNIIDPVIAKITIGAMITFIALMNINRYIIKPLIFKKIEVEDEPDTIGKKVFRYGCLVIGGIVHGAFNIGGPLITVYTIGAVREKEKFRNTMNFVWIILNTYNAINQYLSGAWTSRLWSAIAIGLPFAAIGFFYGLSFLKKINRDQFLRIVYCVLLIVGADMLIRNLLLVV